MHTSRAAIFRSLLNALWLRPESALWYAHMLNAARAFGAASLPGPSLEFGCMDGLNSFVLLGGDVDPAFDVFGDVRWDYNSHRRSTLADDYYDALADGPSLPARNHLHPERRFQFGVDWKQSHIEKAGRFGVHDRLFLWNPGDRLDMFDDGAVGGIWAPNTYWMQDIGGLLREFLRVVRPGGTIITIVPDRSLLEHMLFRHASATNEDWIRNLDRGRYENASRSAASLDEWQHRIGQASLRVERHARFIPPSVGAIYEIGFRPMFAVFMNMYEKLRANSPDALPALKKRWVGTVDRLLAPFFEDSALGPFDDAGLWHMFSLTPVR